MDRHFPPISSFKNCDYFHSVLMRGSEVVDFADNETKLGNFILNMVLPITAVGSMEMTSRRVQPEKQYFTILNEPFSRVTVFLAGSSGEGMCLPMMIHTKGGSYKTDFSDEDWKYVLNDFVVCPNRNRAFAFPEAAPDASPIFLQLKYNTMFPIQNRQAHDRTYKSKLGRFRPQDILTGNSYINRQKFMQHIRYALRHFVHCSEYEVKTLDCMKGTPNISFSTHGPAITAETEDQSTKTTHSRDYVISLPCPKWPDQANGWLTRQRVWPDKSLVKRVVRQGCHIVPKPFRKEVSRKEEFMYSFSLCDRTITRFLSLHQKRCYLLFKYVFSYFLNKVDRGLSSYFCKTTFLWLCERRPCEMWTEYNPLECLVELLQDLKRYLKAKHLPQYYIPEHNLLGETNELCLSACVNDIDALLRSPAEIFLNLTDNHHFSWLSRDVSLVTILQPLFIHDQERLLGDYILSFMSTMIDKAEIQLVIPIICQQWTGDYTYPETIDVIEAIEDVIEQHREHPDIVNFFAVVANLYHHMANTEQTASNKEYCNKSLKIFRDIIEDVGEHVWIYGAYYDLLYQCQEFATLIRHFVATNEAQQIFQCSGVYNEITAYNYLTALPNNFENLSHIDAYFPSPAYILFKVTLAYAKLAKESRTIERENAIKGEAKKSLVFFQKWCLRKQELYPSMTDDVMYYILSIAACAVGDFKIVKEAIDASLGIGTCVFENIRLKYVPLENDSSLSKLIRRSGSSERRHHPYKKCFRHASHHLPISLRFPGGKVRVGKFIHQ